MDAGFDLFLSLLEFVFGADIFNNANSMSFGIKQYYRCISEVADIFRGIIPGVLMLRFRKMIPDLICYIYIYI